MVMTTSAMIVTMATMADIVPRGTMLYHYPYQQAYRDRADYHQQYTYQYLEPTSPMARRGLLAGAAFLADGWGSSPGDCQISLTPLGADFRVRVRQADADTQPTGQVYQRRQQAEYQQAQQDCRRVAE